MTHAQLRVVVMGGSLGGLTAALCLRDAGCDVTVYERSRVPLTGLGAGIVLNPATVRYFTERTTIDVHSISIAARWLRYLDETGAIVHAQPYAYRFSSYNALYRSLLDCFGDEHYHLDTTIVDFAQDPDGVDIRLADGRSLRCDLLVCADGIRSAARRLLLPDVRLQYAGYVAWRGTIEQDQLDSYMRDVVAEAITYHVMEHSHFLSYPIPVVDRAGALQPHANWLWYRNVTAGPALSELLTDREGHVREVSLPPAALQPRVTAELHSQAEQFLPPPLATMVRQTAEPFIQAVFDAEVSQMAFGRICLIGDAAFVARPHAAAGSAKAAADAWKLGEALSVAGGDVVTALRNWEIEQLNLGRAVLARTRAAGQRAQFENSWHVGESLPFGLYAVGDSEMPDR